MIKKMNLLKIKMRIKYDLGEDFEDLEMEYGNINEIYKDLNNNNQWDEDEPYIDKGNGKKDYGQNVVIVEIDDESYD